MTSSATKASASTASSTILHRLAQWAEIDPQAVAQRFKRSGTWVDITSKEYLDRVYHIALFLESRGITTQDIGCVFGPNSAQWVHADLGMLLLGGKSAGIYPNSIEKDVLYVLEHTDAKVLSVANREFFEKVGGAGKSLPSQIKVVLVFDGDASISPLAVAYEDALKEGRALAAKPGAKKISDFLSRIDPKAPAFMIYTSGTTGNPKGALLSHDNFTFTSDIVSKYWKLPYGRGSLFSFLPLCHVAEKLQSVAVGISQRYTVNYATKFDAVSFELPEVQPQLMLSVPRLWEKMMEGVLVKVKNSPPAKKKLAEWAMSVGARVSQIKLAGKRPSALDQAQLLIADKLVLSKVRHALGLGRCEALASGAAALSSHVSKWFRCLGLDIMEDYGQTETTGVVCMTEPGKDSSGTVGRPLPGIEVKIAEDGEILTRGRQVFVGYFKDEEATKKTFVEGGWLATGDLGEYTDKGTIRIKGRKKEILKTSGGKMVAPLPIEEELKAAPMISQVCMVGDNRKYLSILVTLSEPAMKEFGVASSSTGTISKTIDDAKVVAQVKSHVDALNHKLASYEQIKRFAILAHEFSIEKGEMTPTLKMKRNVIEKNYADIIESFYK
jgi:long-chain acyl-CoA synthetase